MAFENTHITLNTGAKSSLLLARIRQINREIPAVANEAAGKTMLEFDLATPKSDERWQMNYGEIYEQEVLKLCGNLLEKRGDKEGVPAPTPAALLDENGELTLTGKGIILTALNAGTGQNIDEILQSIQEILAPKQPPKVK